MPSASRPRSFGQSSPSDKRPNQAHDGDSQELGDIVQSPIEQSTKQRIETNIKHEPSAKLERPTFGYYVSEHNHLLFSIQVPSFTNPEQAYTVSLARGEWSCTCRDSTIRRHTCKHITHVMQNDVRVLWDSRTSPYNAPYMIDGKPYVPFAMYQGNPVKAVFVPLDTIAVDTVLLDGVLVCIIIDERFKTLSDTQKLELIQYHVSEYQSKVKF